MYMPVLPEARQEVAGKVPFRPVRRMVARTGASQRGCEGVAVGVGVEVTVTVGVGLDVRDCELLGVPVMERVGIGVGICEDEGVAVPV